MTEEIENNLPSDIPAPSEETKEDKEILSDQDQENSQDEEKEDYNRIERLFFVDLKKKIRRIDSNLRTLITGKIVFILLNSKDKFLIDGTSSEIDISKCNEDSGDCTIKISSPHLIAIEEGKLNPQIAMLSDKIHVEGDSNLALYAFNLFAPSIFR